MSDGKSRVITAGGARDLAAALLKGRSLRALMLAGLLLGGAAALNPVNAQEAADGPAPPAAAPDAESAAEDVPAAGSDPAGSDASPAAPAETGAGTAAPDTPEAPAEEPTAAEGAPTPEAPPAVDPEATPEAPAEAGPASGPVVVVSWGGVYSQSQEEAIYRPFTRATGIEVSRKIYAGDLDPLRSQAAEGEVVWDVVDVDPADAETGCREGLFEKLSFVLPAAPDGTAAEDDFLPGTIHTCGIGSVAWSMVIAYDGATYDTAEDAARADDARPASLEDFFDLTAFPGKRGLRRTPMANLEWALLADGAAPEEVYDLLGTKTGVARALAKLDTIREAIVWWEDAGDPADLLASGEVVMTSTYNAPIFNDIAVHRQPFGLVWDHQIWDIDLWAVPSGAPHRAAALEFLRFATDTQHLASQTRWIPYGPVRRSSLPLTGDYVHAEVDISPYLPSHPDNLETALRNDAIFWREKGPELVEQFNAWLAR